LKDPLSEKPPEFIRKAFPHTCYYPKLKLLTWHPRGLLNDAFADQVIEFIEMEERIQDAPFNRFTDFSGLSDIRLKVDHFFDIGRRRSAMPQPVKSAFFADKAINFYIARMYEMMMDKAMIEVRAFRERSAAAEWLAVPLQTLHPPS
jgi:hypothetical protein